MKDTKSDKKLKDELINNLEIVFQPIYSLTNKRNVAYEVLSRLYDEESNLLPTVEITERGDFSYTELMYKLLKLKKIWIKVAMDDFPIGSSNLENLLRTYLKSVKIDRELIK